MTRPAGESWPPCLPSSSRSPTGGAMAFETELVRDLFQLPPPPKTTRYHYGWNEFAWRSGECRDEQAWLVELEHSGCPETLQLVTIRLRPGVSLREAHKAVAIAIKACRERTPVQAKRPSLTKWERDFMRALFQHLEKQASRPVKPALIIRTVGKAMKIAGAQRSKSAIANEHRLWRSEMGRPVRKYVTERKTNPKNP